jgi:hypothetical protein
MKQLRLIIEQPEDDIERAYDDLVRNGTKELIVDCYVTEDDGIIYTPYNPQLIVALQYSRLGITVIYRDLRTGKMWRDSYHYQDGDYQWYYINVDIIEGNECGKESDNAEESQ